MRNGGTPTLVSSALIGHPTGLEMVNLVSVLPFFLLCLRLCVCVLYFSPALSLLFFTFGRIQPPLESLSAGLH